MSVPLCSNIYDDVTYFEICEDFTKTVKHKYLQNETLFFLQMKKFINIANNGFVAEVTFNSSIAITNTQ